MAANNDRECRAPAQWRRRDVLVAVALGALAGCGGGGDDLVRAGTKFLDLKFADAETAYGVGKQGLVARSDDGGQTWRRLPVDSTSDMVHVVPADRQLVFVSTADTGLLRSVDGGTSWQTIREGSGSPWAVDGSVAFATDADHVGLRLSADIRFIDQLKVTVDGGHEWRTMLRPDIDMPWAPQVTRSGLMFILYGDARVLWVSDDFGRSFRPTPLSGVACGAFGERGIWLQRSSGGAGNAPAGLAFSQDAFRTWDEVPMQVTGFAADGQPPIFVSTLDADGRGWAMSNTAVFHSGDGGRTWSAVAAPTATNHFIIPLDGVSGFMDGDSSVAPWFTTDAGATWRRLDGVPADAFATSMARDGGGGLLVAVGIGPLYGQEGSSWQRSVDDGRSWRTLP